MKVSLMMAGAVEQDCVIEGLLLRVLYSNQADPVVNVVGGALSME